MTRTARRPRPIIRAVDPARDIPAIARIERAFFALAWNAATIREYLATPGRGGSVVTVSGRVVGYILHEPEPRGRGRYIASLAVDRRHRGRGHATRLLRRMIATGERLKLHVGVGNVGAMTLYQKLGFQTRRREAAYYAPELAAFVMTRLPEGTD